jgi:hypothetical protein
MYTVSGLIEIVPAAPSQAPRLSHQPQNLSYTTPAQAWSDLQALISPKEAGFGEGPTSILTSQKLVYPLSSVVFPWAILA